MKRISSFSFFRMVISSFGGWFAFLFTLHAVPLTLHVDPSSNRPGRGVVDAPFQTLEQARDELRTRRDKGAWNPADGAEIVIAPGDFHRTTPFELNAGDSGTPSAPIIYRAAEPRKTTIRGDIILDPEDFKQVTNPEVLKMMEPAARDKVRVIDLSKIHPKSFEPFPNAVRGISQLPPGPTVFGGGKVLTLSRWPNLDASNHGWAEFTKVIDNGMPDRPNWQTKLAEKHPGAFVWNDDRAKRWNDPAGAWFAGFAINDWHEDILQIGHYDADKKELRLGVPATYGLDVGKREFAYPGRRFFVMNTITELDVPGEWFLDRTNKLLYIYPPVDWPKTEISISTIDAVMPRPDISKTPVPLRPLIVISKPIVPLIWVKGAHDVSFRGLKFGQTYGRGMQVDDSERISIDHCEFSEIEHIAVAIEGGRSNHIVNSDFSSLGNTGIYLSGGDRKHMVAGEHVVENCDIAGWDRYHRGSFGIGIDGWGQVVRNNRLHDAPYTAIMFQGNEHRIELNDIGSVCLEALDCGAIYSQKDWTARGTLIQHNFIHDLGYDEPQANSGAYQTSRIGVYFDSWLSGNILWGNVFLRAGRVTFFNSSRDCVVDNNLMVDSAVGPSIDARALRMAEFNAKGTLGDTEAKAEAMNYRRPPWSVKYPRLVYVMEENPAAPLHNEIVNNLIIHPNVAPHQFGDALWKGEKMLSFWDQLNVGDNWVASLPKGVSIDARFSGFEVVSGQKQALIEKVLPRDERNRLMVTQEAINQLVKAFPDFQPIPFDRIGTQR